MKSSSAIILLKNKVRSQLMPHAHYTAWISDTEHFGKPRSSALKAVDRAVMEVTSSIYYLNQMARYTSSQILLNRLKLALDAWIKTKGINWKSSIRNHKKKIEKTKSWVDAKTSEEIKKHASYKVAVVNI